MTTIDRIRELLDQKGVSPTCMMTELGYSRGLFSQWKSGLQKPSSEKLSAIAEYLDVSVDYLLGKSATPNPTLTDDDIKFALFNGSEGVTDEMYEEVKQFAAMVKLREQQKRGAK